MTGLNSQFGFSSLIVGTVWFTACQLLFEAKKVSRFYGYLVGAAIFAGLAFVIHSLVNYDFRHFLMFSMASLAFLLISPFLGRSSFRDNIATFTYAVIGQVAYTAVISTLALIAVEFVGISITKLLGIKILDFEITLAVLVLSLLSPLITFLGFPADFKSVSKDLDLRRVYLAIAFVFVPILLVDGIVLYGYFGSLILNQTLPDGIIVYMVSGFGCGGILLYLAVDHSNTEKPIAIEWFHRHFFKFLFVPLVLMAVAIAIRVNQHGMTQSRCDVILLGVWMFFLSLISLTKWQNELSKLAYLSATVFCLLELVLFRLTFI